MKNALLLTKLLLISIVIFFPGIKSFGQNTGISDVANTPVSSAVLDVYSTSKGFLVPRLTQAQKLAVASPATGLLIYQTNGTAGFYYYDGTAWVPFTTSSTGWLLDGNSVTSTRTLGTITNYDLPIITNSSERMRVTKAGAVGIGSVGFDAINPERLLVDYGTTASNKIATFRGSLNNYLQINIQNTNSGSEASTDIVATADNGTDSTNYIDMGINSSTYAPGVDNFGGPNDGYLYTYSRHLVIGTANTNSDIIFLVNGGQLSVNQAMRVDGASKNIIIGRRDNSSSPSGNTVRGPNGSGTNISGGSLSFAGGNATGTGIGGAINITGGSTVSGTGGAVNINAGTNNAANINTGANNQNVTIGSSTNNIILPKWSTVGGVYYNATAGGQLGDASLLVWDNANTRLGVGTASPTTTLYVAGNAITTGNMTVGTTTLPASPFRMQIVNNGSSTNGLLIHSGEIPGDIALRLEDQDASFNIMDVEADQGMVVLGKTCAATLLAEGIVYGIDQQNDNSVPGDADFNTKFGVYRQDGVPISPYNIGGGIVNSSVTATAVAATTSTTYVLVTGMTATPAAGTYMVSFSSSGRGTNTDQQMQVSLFANGLAIAHTQRSYGYNTNSGNTTKRFDINTQALITVTGSQAIDVRYKTNNGTFNIDERSLILIKVTD